MTNISCGLRLASFVLFLFFFSACSANGQTEPSSQSALPESPVSKPAVLDNKGSAHESSKPVIANSTPMSRKFTGTTKLWVASSLAVYTAAALDMHATEETAQLAKAFHRRYPWWPADYSFEANPLARPLLKLPAPAYYACGVVLATGVNYVGLRMSRSRRFRRVWWLPQALSATGNTRGYLSYQ